MLEWVSQMHPFPPIYDVWETIDHFLFVIHIRFSACEKGMLEM